MIDGQRSQEITGGLTKIFYRSLRSQLITMESSKKVIISKQKFILSVIWTDL